MSEFDGEIRINTKINTADAEKMLMKLEEKMQQRVKSKFVCKFIFQLY